MSVFKYIEASVCFANTKMSDNTERIHQTLNYQTPEEFEKDYAASLAA
jgi:putative transposase